MLLEQLPITISPQLHQKIPNTNIQYTGPENLEQYSQRLKK